MQSAAAYRLEDRWLVHPNQQTTAGVWVSVAPYLTLPPTADYTALGNAVLEALEHSVGVMPHPKDWKGLGHPRLAAAGVKSEKAFQLGSRLVLIERSPSGYAFQPTKNGGYRGDAKGFTPLSEQRSTLSLDCDGRELGHALKDALQLCTQEA